jgi:acetyl esterase/lipase
MMSNMPCQTLRFLPVPLGLLFLSICQSRCKADGVGGEIARPIRVERDLEYRRVDGTAVLADLYRPDDDQIYPLVLMVHGGAWSTGDKWNLVDHARELAQAGFVALSINYRLAPKYQMPEQIADCRAALTWAAAQATLWKADSQRICLWGYSAGAHLSAWMATDRQPGEPPLRCVVAGGAPCDFDFIPSDSSALVHVMGGTRKKLPEYYAQASPLTHASADSPPFFFFHGSADLLVPPESSRKLYERLRSFGVETEYHTVENQGHLLTFLNSPARRQAIEYLRKHTKEEAN